MGWLGWCVAAGGWRVEGLGSWGVGELVYFEGGEGGGDFGMAKREGWIACN